MGVFNAKMIKFGMVLLVFAKIILLRLKENAQNVMIWHSLMVNFVNVRQIISGTDLFALLIQMNKVWPKLLILNIY